MKAVVHVNLKPDVLDPQGKAIRKASTSLGLAAVTDVRQGKLFELEIDESDRERALAIATELCEKLLANPVIESYRVVSLEPSR